jgi:2,4-dienoyl-CoA reductase-like NADH-dependent reductase (Old Yellow Enzyme family)/NADPH-dependent 2,4-dienoyl-CoA reductase/sulfur reductase-like enzyme
VANDRFANLLAPGRIGTLELKNRIYMTAMGTNLAKPDGVCGGRTRAYYGERAKGGVGLITVGSVGVAWPVGSALQNQLAISEDRHVPGIKALVDEVHGHGAKIALQLHFGGLVAATDMKEGRPVWTPSIPSGKAGDLVDGFLESELAAADFLKFGEIKFRVMTREDVRELVRLFVAAAQRTRAAGADGIELHGGHGYIFSSFLSPYTNQRTDEYGGSVENRARLLLETIGGIRSALGRDFPLWVKIDTQEFGKPEGIGVEDAMTVARLVEAAGADAITASTYADQAWGINHSGSNIPDVPETMVPGAIAVKSAVKIPVLASGRIELAAADRHIGDGGFDFLGLGRPLLADAHLARKLWEGRAADVRPCIYCYCCVSQIYFSRPVKCAVNPDTGFERELAVAPAVTRKRIVVIGGGPAGLETARRLAQKGHEVMLLEQSDRLGGTAQFAAIAYQPNERVVEWLRRQIDASGVDVRLKTRATPELIRSLSPDTVVVATGAVRTMPPIPGAERSNVLSGEDMRRLVLGEDLGSLKGKTGWSTRIATKVGSLTGATKSFELIRSATRAWMPLGKRIVIIGGELVGLELAEFLAHRGRQVTVIDDAARFGAGLHIVRRWRALAELRELGVALLTHATEIAIGENCVTYVNLNGQARTVGADHVIVAKGAMGDLRLADSLRAAGFNVKTAGDCGGVGYIEGAMGDAARVAAEI